MWRRRSWFSLKGKAGIPGQTEGRPATSIGPRVPPVGSLQQRDAKAKGEHLGRKPSYTRPQYQAVLDLLAQGADISTVAKTTGLTRQTVYRIEEDPAAAATALSSWGL